MSICQDKTPLAAAPDFLQPSDLFHQQRRFETWAQKLIRLPQTGEGPVDHLLPEFDWQRLLGQALDQENWLSALTRATGIYFFPSREWPGRLMNWLKRIGVRRLLEAGAGRGYLSAALAPLCATAGVAFKAVDRRDGEFTVGLPSHSSVETADVFVEVDAFGPEVVFFAWPPPGQSLAPLFSCTSLRFLLMAGEPGGGLTGAPADWETLSHKKSAHLSQCCRGRTGQTRHRMTIFWQKGTRG